MSKRRRVPEDLMGTILGEGSGFSSDERASSWSTGSRSADRRTAASASDDERTMVWEEQPERVGTTFNLSKQVGRELDKLRLELQLEEGIRSSNSDRAKEDTGAAHGALGGTTDEVGWTTQRRVDDSGRIFETTYNRNGEIAGEEAVGDVADLPVEAEYLDEEGRFRSLANDELGNTFEWVMDNEFNTIGARLVRGTD